MKKLEQVSCEGVTWINIEKPTREDIEALAQYYPFHRLDLEDCLSKIQLTKIDEYEDYLFIILHFPIIDDSTGMVRSSQVSIFLGKDYLVTIHQGDLKPLINNYRICKIDESRREKMVIKGSVYILYQIIDSLVDDIFPTLNKLMEELYQIEDKVFDEKVEAVREVTFLRRKIADLRRIIFPLRRVMKELTIKVQRFSRQDISNYFDDINDHIEKIWETLEECKETIEIYKDTDFILATEKTNKILALLTIVFTLSIPATVIATFYGMNIPLPGGIETGPWTFLGPYTTLIIITIISIIPALVMLVIFRRLGWI
ncbi:MAG: magnesium transporter CorA family protein [Nitrososphaerota archaeon]|nr:magnesium transporter CorA family protein [Nitrososphaerales archaeon]MDW8044334.1 magnesium transporter CorA family protein [Nitrososphaerota archaeon]